MTKEVKDFFGRVIAVVKEDGDKSRVSDWTGRSLGSADDKGTKDYLGKVVSPDNVPDILIRKEGS